MSPVGAERGQGRGGRSRGPRAPSGCGGRRLGAGARRREPEGKNDPILGLARDFDQCRGAPPPRLFATRLLSTPPLARYEGPPPPRLVATRFGYASRCAQAEGSASLAPLVWLSPIFCKGAFSPG